MSQTPSNLRPLTAEQLRAELSRPELRGLIAVRHALDELESNDVPAALATLQLEAPRIAETSVVLRPYM